MKNCAKCPRSGKFGARRPAALRSKEKAPLFQEVLFPRRLEVETMDLKCGRGDSNPRGLPFRLGDTRGLWLLHPRRSNLAARQDYILTDDTKTSVLRAGAEDVVCVEALHKLCSCLWGFCES